MSRAKQATVQTPHGPARVHLHVSSSARAGLILGHGAGGGVGAPDLQAATEAAIEANVSVALIEQPYRVAGRRSPAPANQLDAAWIAVVEHLTNTELSGLPKIVGGRSAGARVACRTAEQTAAVAVLCLAFPLTPPARNRPTPPASRLPELEQLTIPVLVVQGTNDRFGMPPPAPNREVAEVRGDHSLRGDADAVRRAVSAWLQKLPLPSATAARTPPTSSRQAAARRRASSRAR